MESFSSCMNKYFITEIVFSSNVV